MNEEALGVNWKRMMDAAPFPMVVLAPDLTLLHRNPASIHDPVFSSLDPGQSLSHTGLRSAGPLRERTDARREFIEACMHGAGPQCFSETLRRSGADEIVFWICLRTSSDRGELLLVIGLGEALRHSNGLGIMPHHAAVEEFRLPLTVLAGEAESLADLLEEPMRGRASVIGKTARHMLDRLTQIEVDPIRV